MNIYAEGGLVMMGVYGLTSLLKNWVDKRFLALVPLLLTPAIGAAYALITGQMDVVEAIQIGLAMGAGTIAAHEVKDHVIIGK